MCICNKCMCKVKSVITNNLMKIYRKICTVSLNFNNKTILGVHFFKTSKKFVKVQDSTVRLNDISNT